MDVSVSGDGACTVVAVHGIQGTRDSWRPVMARVSAARWVLPNLRGRGTAWRGTAPQHYTLACYAEELAEVVRTHVSRPYVLAGWSLGVSIGVAALADRLLLPPPAAVLWVSGSPALCETQWFQGDGDVLADSVVARRQRLGLLTYADDEAVRCTWQAIRQSDQRPLLDRINVPAVVMHGVGDTDCPPAHADWLARGLAAPCHLLDGVGHGVLAQAPDAVAAQLTALCDRAVR